MNRNSFYIAKFNDGTIDRKINLTQRDLILAFTNGRFYGCKEGDIRIFKVDLDCVTVDEVSVSGILTRIRENKLKRKEVEKRRRNREIEEEIVKLRSKLK